MAGNRYQLGDPTLWFVSGSQPRYRCNACGNLTRFDVVISRTTRSFHHFTVGGELSIEDEEVLSEVVDDVRCRWCGTDASVVQVDDDSVAGPVGSCGHLGPGDEASPAESEAPS